ncbi:MAG: signal peptidase I [Gammaproteobacteria bacterium]|nr:signal peptidase I [Gammaproteobacteria bacterium]
MVKKLKSLIREWRGFITFLALLLIFRGAIADWYAVPTGSMKPTIIEGDRVFVNKLAFGLRLPFSDVVLGQWGEPQRGEIVVFYSPTDGTRLIKRVVGLPGDTISIQGNKLQINGHTVKYSPSEKSYSLTIWQNGVSRDVLEEELGEHRHPIALIPQDILVEDFGPVTVPDGHYFMMGDNRHNSADSRVIGFVPRQQLLGRASHVVMSLDYDNFYLPRSDRVLSKLP